MKATVKKTGRGIFPGTGGYFALTALFLAALLAAGAQDPPEARNPSAAQDPPYPAEAIGDSTADRPSGARFVWKDAAGSGRQQKVLFRRTFEIRGPAGPAEMHIFADSRYHLYVNGTHIGFGPSRFYPRDPQYDSYDLSGYLREGRNAIAVEVLSNGTETFQVPLSIGGLIAWGEVVTGTGVISLETPGDWKMSLGNAFRDDALRFSFACGPMEIFDARLEAGDWKTAGFDDSGWEVPVEVGRQDHWGSLAPRTIPQLTRDELVPLELLGIYEPAGDEQVYSFFIKTPDETNKLYNSGWQMYASTYMYSPREQEVELGLWWGDYYLNGEGPLEVSGREAGNPVRQNRIFRFRKGWNFLFISYVAIWGGWDYYMAIPVDAGLCFSPRKKRDTGPEMLTAGPFPEKAGIFDPALVSPGDERRILSDERFCWVSRQLGTRGPNPARDLVWKKLDLDRNLKPNDYRVSDIVISRPVTLVFDLGGKQLGRLFVEADGEAGVVVDMGWSEDLNSLGMPYLYKRLQVNAAVRFITREGHDRYETFKPYGARYLQVHVDPGGSPCIIKKTGIIRQVYPFSKRGSFACSNPMLDRIWELGWRTLRVCAEDSYIDTPFRERGLYAGDALPEYAITLATSGDSRLMKRSLMLFQDMYRETMYGANEEGLGDFVLLTLLELNWYYQVTGDLEFVRSLYPNYHSLMQHIMERRNDAGYYAPGRVFIEWTKIDKTADLTAYQAYLAEAFRSMEALAGALGFGGDAAMYGTEAGRLEHVVNTLFWDEGNGAYRDGFRGGEAIGHHYPVSSVLPLLFEISPRTREDSLVAFLDRELRDIGEETRNRKITPYGSFYLFAALYRTGHAALAERFMLRYWSRMIRQGDDTSWENFDIGGEEGGGQGTASHAWSGHPTFFLSTEVLGVRLGFSHELDRSQIEISPQSGTLSWARGTVPHPAGLVGVDWRIEGERLMMHLLLPEGVPYRVNPRGRLAGLALELTVETYPAACAGCITAD
jgi:alpha-L-rhamnosidase